MSRAGLPVSVPTPEVGRRGNISSLNDVTITSVSDTQILKYDSSAAKWVNSTLGTISTQSASSVAITGGSVTGITDLAVADGGTGASTAAAARTSLGVSETLVFAISDETTALTTGVGKVSFRMPFALTLQTARASLTTASSSGAPTVDIKLAGSSIFTTNLLVINVSAVTSTSATSPNITTTALTDDSALTFDITVAGTGAVGLKVYLTGVRP